MSTTISTPETQSVSYELRVRSQSAKKGRSGFSGPNAYVVVLVVPVGVTPPQYNNRKLLAARGIEYHYFGEGYSAHTGPRSSLGRAIAAAGEWIKNKKINARYAAAENARMDALLSGPTA